MSVIEAKANNAASELAQTQGIDNSVALDPATILALLEIIMQVMKMLQNCRKTPENALLVLRNPSIMERWALKRIVKRVVDDEDVHKLYGRQFLNSIVSVGHSCSLDEVTNMYKEVSHNGGLLNV
jgi:hypothetical protein